jgi:hypothetical protein
MNPFHSPTPFFINSFAADALIDARGIDRDQYAYSFVRSEFLGEIRCLVFDIQPKDTEHDRFKGRIWVEDKDYNIVRFNGVYLNPPRGYRYFHCDSWRENLLPGQWLPVYIYSEEEGLHVGHVGDREKDSRDMSFRSQTRFWGYDLSGASRNDELTEILVEAKDPVKDNSEAASSIGSPLASQRQWETESEQNVLDRLEKARLLAPPSEMDKVLEVVVNNLIVTNHYENLPPVHCRVLLTLPFESFTLGHTIILSRGLIDVLPDEASLAMMLSHELAHIVLGHLPDTRYGFHDRLISNDEDLLKSLDFSHSPEEEKAADAKGLDLLKNSPYNSSLGSAGMFLRAMTADYPHTPNLFGAHLGDRLGADSGQLLVRMATLMNSAGQYQPAKLDQIAALPLGSRVVVNAKNGEVSMTKNKAPAPLSPREKMPFQITPLYPYLRRLSAPASASLTVVPANPPVEKADSGAEAK